MDGNTPQGAHPAAPSHFSLRAAIGVALATLLLAAALASGARAATLPPQGLYDQCSPAGSGDACASHLDQMSQAGFTRVLNYTSWDGTPQQVVAFADQVAAHGMQAIWPLNNPVWRNNGDITSVYPKLATACGCSNAWALLAYVTNLLKGHAATWGWYVGDEVPPLQLPAVLALQAQVKLLDPGHPTLYIAYEHSGYNGANLGPFATAADVVGTDVYPYGNSGGDPLYQVKFVADLTRRLVGALGRSTAMVVQAFDWNQHPDEITGATGGFPDFNYLRAARDAAVNQAGVSLLLWYSYPDIQRSDDPAGHWNDVVQAAFGQGSAPAAVPVAPAPTAAPVAKKAKKAAGKAKAKRSAKAKKRARGRAKARKASKARRTRA